MLKIKLAILAIALIALSGCIQPVPEDQGLLSGDETAPLDFIPVDGTIEKEIRDTVTKYIGPIAKPAEIIFSEGLPKTRSGKIMRRVLKARALGQDEGDLSTLED
jgi:acyl-CoA synthetase (AMP-forming)/AMP-acid ligase II